MGGLTYHALRVAGVVEETAEARSILLEVPPALRAAFAFEPGQHLQMRVPCGERPLPRCYSLSTMRRADDLVRVTVKRTVDGRASNWLCTQLRPGDSLEVAAPAGMFRPRALDGDFLMFAAGSGITPVYSIIETVLHAGAGRIRLVYANRDERSIIFAQDLARLSREHPRRLQVIHWLDSVQGMPSQAQLASFGDGWDDDVRGAQCFVCGPAPFMDMATGALHDLHVPHAQVHVERFVSLPDDADTAPLPAAPAANAAEVEIEAELDGAMHRLRGYNGQLLIEALEAGGLVPPYSCRAGACAACMCKLEDGEVELLSNHVLEQDDLDQGWILSCQAVMQSPHIKVKYPT